MPTGLGAAVETLVLFVRDEIAEKNIGHDGRKFVPLLLSFFFFILVAALLGLMPFSRDVDGQPRRDPGPGHRLLPGHAVGGHRKYGVVHHFTEHDPARPARCGCCRS